MDDTLVLGHVSLTWKRWCDQLFSSDSKNGNGCSFKFQCFHCKLSGKFSVLLSTSGMEMNEKKTWKAWLSGGEGYFSTRKQSLPWLVVCVWLNPFETDVLKGWSDKVYFSFKLHYKNILFYKDALNRYSTYCKVLLGNNHAQKLHFWNHQVLMKRINNRIPGTSSSVFHAQCAKHTEIIIKPQEASGQLRLPLIKVE